MAEAVKVFVSYSWGVDDKTKLVAQLDPLCKARGIELIYDKQELKYKDRISSFMDKIAEAEHVITIFSKPYFESEYCMYELMKIQERGSFDQRIHPIRADTFEFNKSKARREVIRHWNEFVASEEEDIEELGAGVAPDQHEKLNLYQQIELKVSGIMANLGDMVITPLEQLQADHFAQLLDNIALPKSEHPHIPESSDSEFLETIKENIVFELESHGVEIFRDAIRDELEKLLQKLKLDKLVGDSSNAIATSLITTLKQGDSSVPVITTVLMNAAQNCFDKRGRHFKAAREHHSNIQSAVEQLLGWLVLASVDDDYIQRLTPSRDHATAVYFELPVSTLGGVEIIVSRSYQRQANINAQGSILSGKHITHNKRVRTWKVSEKTNQLMLEVWNQVFKDLKKDSGSRLSRTEISKLNAELEIRRSDNWHQEHHILAIECSDLENDKDYSDTCEQLLNELDQLTLVRFGIADQQQVFYSPEHNLMSAVNRFLTSINRTINA
ncbi:toll/interleukin-1 receptor domain-containing protein [Leucothrix pacifica]|uniref:toll/interleukin-1 receptor domain-containing protein n=1 Tax=Leucothrix pacifica TaxID=1247513 RepID=UPI0015E84EB2|nr:toll/interleukin-1 receptor domain-containing protein [Leucothrix pacifica]